VLDRGTVGESYVIGGEITRLGNVIDMAGRLLGRKPPRFTIPAWAAKMSIPMAPLVTRIMGTAPNLAELIRSADGVTYWATEAKARRDLGYAPRGLEAGLRRTFGLDGGGATAAADA
jgi:dihydroflavonol-4-reductase